ncbi:hypothetical protein BST63_03365 [Bradyrhizobium canariense]|uniref:Uncharacterized protein n=1 Tax=Bradyrhizobium canariense TaxID=255045 RepID=A0ABX3XA60_9BRAD|nr:hypothetical protein BSR47_03735 [Bradyrhizobium canariense]OSJ34619.1 hypothetical protein BST63_03365 [Bradyrhizobium canariense]
MSQKSLVGVAEIAFCVEREKNQNWRSDKCNQEKPRNTRPTHPSRSRGAPAKIWAKTVFARCSRKIAFRSGFLQSVVQRVIIRAGLCGPRAGSIEVQQHRKDRRQHEEGNQRHFRAERRKPDRVGQQELLVRGGAGADKKVKPNRRVLIQMVETRVAESLSDFSSPSTSKPLVI